MSTSVRMLAAVYAVLVATTPYKSLVSEKSGNSIEVVSRKIWVSSITWHGLKVKNKSNHQQSLGTHQAVKEQLDKA